MLSIIYITKKVSVIVSYPSLNDTSDTMTNNNLMRVRTHARGEPMKEQEIVNDIKKYLQTIPKLFYWKEHGGQFGTAGIPDIIVCYKGKFIAFECKRPGGKPTVLQKITINKIAKAGGIVQVVTSVEQVKEVIERL